MLDININCHTTDIVEVGVTTSYQTANRMIEDIGKHYYNAIVERVRNGPPFRIIMDNINVYVRSNMKELLTMVECSTGFGQLPYYKVKSHIKCHRQNKDIVLSFYSF
ncbi:hypothetical protein ACJMK2_029969 [Sinanodonta woodiana]|uniref:Transposase n=1 Tax=Sinanodonta woodiana TaxID=1069815 RepID=A0ABD3XBT4_SINWO